MPGTRYQVLKMISRNTVDLKQTIQCTDQIDQQNMALNEAKEKVCQLENAIKKLDAIKKHLSHSASDIKVEIHSCVSHNLESLRGREVSLLGKVDELVALKEEALQRQQAKLNQALGVLQTRMAMMTTTDSVLDHQLAEILTKFNEIDLSPGETPHIAFRADHMELRECILNYGRVDSNALSLPSAFELPGKPSASLPRHLEEYEDEDHHIFYKTVEELKESNSTTKSITVTIPKLSTRMEDWLLNREVNSPAVPAPQNFLSSGISLAPKVSALAAPPHCSTPGDTCSLNNWLSQIKGHVDLEEEHNFEIVDNSQAKKAKLGTMSDKYEDLKPWLHTSPEYLESLFIAQKQTQNLFRHIPLDSKFWLRQSCGPQVSSMDELKQKDMFRHISKEPSTWLRSRAYGKQTTQRFDGEESMMESDSEKPFLSKDKNISQWLSQSTKTTQENSNNNCCKSGKWLQQQTPSANSQERKTVSFQLEDICKANELCSSMTDCVCKPNCETLHKQELSGVKNPLDPTKVFTPLELPTSEWLCVADNPASSDKMEEDVISSLKEAEADSNDSVVTQRLFGHIADASSDEWLFKPHGSSSSERVSSIVPTFKHCKEEANLWLQQIHDSPNTDNTLLETNAKAILNFNPSNKSLSEWLSSPVVPNTEEDMMENMKEDSEGWSLCSSPATFNSDQYSKDVKVATSYMHDWVL